MKKREPPQPAFMVALFAVLCIVWIVAIVVLLIVLLEARVCTTIFT